VMTFSRPFRTSWLIVGTVELSTPDPGVPAHPCASAHAKT
jgi:hypothetical protein